MVIAGCRPSSDATGTPTSAAAGPSGSAGTVSGRLQITEIDQPGLFAGTDRIVLRSTAAAGSGFVVLGDVGTAEHIAIQAWLSKDGRTWERTPTIEALDHAVINAITEMPGDRLLAVGWNLDGDEVWSSDDAGRTWQARSVAKAPRPTARSVAAGTAGAVLLDTVPIEHGPDQQSRLWFSTNGATWEAVAMPDEVFGTVQISKVVATSNGFVAVGGRAPDSPALAGDPLHGYRAAAWRSVDGRTWSAATVSDKPPFITAVAGAEGLIGFGYGEPIERQQAWISSDGATWLPVPGSGDLEGTFLGHDGNIAWFTSTFVREGVSDLAVQTSRDGAVWTPPVRSGPMDTSGSGLGPTVAGAPGWLQRGSGRDGRPKLWLMTVEPR
jgi:hypothetical protein